MCLEANAVTPAFEKSKSCYYMIDREGNGRQGSNLSPQLEVWSKILGVSAPDIPGQQPHLFCECSGGLFAQALPVPLLAWWGAVKALQVFLEVVHPWFKLWFWVLLETRQSLFGLILYLHM